MMRFRQWATILSLSLLSIVFSVAFAAPSSVGAVAQTAAVVVCFWSDQGPVCVERSVAEESGEALMAALLAGPTSEEQTQGLWSAIPRGTTLDRVETGSDDTVAVYLRVPQAALESLDPTTFEVIVRQVGGTLEPLRWRDLRIQAWNASTRAFVPLASFLPETPVLRKEALLPDEGALGDLPDYIGQPPSPGQGQPQGALSGKTVYVSAGHGWEWTGLAWRTQRPPYPTGGYVGPIIEDHNNAEAVNQYLLQYLWNAGATVIPVRERDLNGAEVIVDNDSPTMGTGYAETGVWTTTTSVGTGYAGTDYRWTGTVTGTTTATAAWTATLPTDGQYAVYVWYRYGPNRAPDARYTVHHAGGETTVAVDQRIHGDTWHYLGTYGFLAGEEAWITLTNRSAVTQTTVVVADAVRFGGGTFDELTSAISTTAPYAPNKPWWEVCTFYYSQRMGLDRGDWLYFNDIVARPMYSRWEHAGTDEDAVYVSWHTNGASGGYQTTTRGTMSIVYNGEDGPVTPGSVALRDAIHAELVHDIRAGWDPTWPEYTRSMNLGELRELWDENEAVRMPGALIEIAFHDHPGDTDALKEPAFEMLAARGMYQGIVKYFEGRDGVDLKLLPEPPTHLAVQNAGGDAVRVSWQPSPTDAVGLVGDAATGYRVYTSTNGVGWSNGVTVTGTTAYTLTGLSSGQLVYVRVAATNDGGESFPTEVLAARAGENAGILLVSGFDRLSRSMLVPETDPTEGYNMRMFLDRMNAYNYTIQHGEAIPYAFDSASNEAVKDGAVGLGQYAVLDWIVGEESTVDETLDATERALLATYLDGGGALFISGAEIGWHLDFLGGDPAFYTGYLHAGYAGDDAGTYQVGPALGSIFAGLALFRFDASGMYDPDYPDQLTPLGGAVAALTYQGGAGGTAAVQYADGCERVVYFGFPFETIEPGMRAAVMGQVLDFLDECLAMTVDTTITSPVDGSAHNSLPDFLGTAGAGAAALDRVEVQIERGDGQYWTESEWSIAETWLVAGGTDAWSYTLPALSDSGYTLRARAWTTDPYSDTSPAEVIFTYDTISPTAAALITPTGGITVSSPVVALSWGAPPDDGSLLSYVVRLDGQTVATTTQTVYTLTHHIANGPHTWGVQVVDAAGNHSNWVTDIFIVYRHNVWVPLVMREESEPPGPTCTNVVVNGGFESDGGWKLNNLAVYATDQVHSGARSARVGIPPGEPGIFVYSSVMQVVTLTEGSSATLSLWLYPIGEGDDSGDCHYTGILAQGGVYQSLGTWQSDARAWEQRQYDLSAYIGQTVTIYIGTKNDGDGDTAALYVDDVAVQICP
ncbi:MAG: fibronectin type III domain-containing protein [Anaerolineae bacterium]|nr:fibronectin type III domain-containing protein [Anaerolineae bacterium]